MNAWQVLRQLQYLIRSRDWTGSINNVFASESVKITSGPMAEAFEKLRLPVCLIRPMGMTVDPEHNDAPDHLEQEIAITLAVAHSGDAFGEYSMVGGMRTSNTRSQGRGLLEVEEELFNAIELLNTDDGIVIQHRASSAVEAQDIRGQFVQFRDYLFRANLTADRHYHPVLYMGSWADILNTPTPTVTPTPSPTVTPTPTPRTPTPSPTPTPTLRTPTPSPSPTPTLRTPTPTPRTPTPSPTPTGTPSPYVSPTPTPTPTLRTPTPSPSPTPTPTPKTPTPTPRTPTPSPSPTPTVTPTPTPRTPTPSPTPTPSLRTPTPTPRTPTPTPSLRTPTPTPRTPTPTPRTPTPSPTPTPSLRTPTPTPRTPTPSPTVTPTPTPTTALLTFAPGAGWGGATAVPADQGSGDHDDEYIICRFAEVPHRTTPLGTSLWAVGVVADHINGVAKIELACDDGGWVEITTESTNPRTSKDEYWAYLECDDADVEGMEIRARCYPVVGKCRVLSDFTISTNYGGTLFAGVKFVDSVSGSDANSGDTAGAAYATLYKAGQGLQVARGDGKADGGIIKLLAGDYDYAGYTSGSVTTTNRWLTIQPNDGLFATDCPITTGSAWPNGMRTKLVCIAVNVEPETTSESFLVANNPNQVSDASVWMKNQTIQGPIAQWPNKIGWYYGWGQSGGTLYWTDHNARYVWCVMEGGGFARDIDIEWICGDAIRNTNCVYTLAFRDAYILLGSHPDLIQTYSSSTPQNFYWRDFLCEDNLESQGMYIGSDYAVQDIAFIDWTFETDMLQTEFQAASPCRHLVYRRFDILGLATWRDDSNFTANSIHLEDFIFDSVEYDGTAGKRVTFQSAGDVADAEITYNLT